MDRVRILLVDSHSLFREALPLLLNSQSDLETVAVAGAADEALRQAATFEPNVVLLDIALPDRNGIALLPELRERSPSSHVIVLTAHEGEAYLQSAFAAGAVGYVVKSSPSTVLFEAIRTTQRGEKFLDPSLRQTSAAVEQPPGAQQSESISRLSDRERQVLHWLAHGLRYRAIAEKMGVSVKTVETYRSRLSAKLSFKDRSDLMRFAIAAGIMTNTSSND